MSTKPPPEFQLIVDILRKAIRQYGIAITARNASMTESMVSRLAGGQTKFSLEHATRIAKACGLRITLIP